MVTRKSWLLALISGLAGCLNSVNPGALNDYAYVCSADGDCSPNEICVSGLCATTDAGVGDAGKPDSGQPDSGPPDGGATDSGATASCLARFQVASPLTGCTACGHIGTGDFDADGRADLVALDENNGDLVVLLGRGSGNFVPASSADTEISLNGCDGDLPIGLAVGDFNDDGWADVALSFPVSDDIGVLLNNHDGGFAAGGTGPTSIDAADTGFCSTTSGDPYPVSVFHGDAGWQLSTIDADDSASAVVSTFVHADGTFGALTSNGFLASPSALTTGDVNGDGFMDLAVVTTPVSGRSIVDVLLGSADAGFAAIAKISAGNATSDVRLADLNHDGIVDLVFTNAGDNTVGVSAGLEGGGYASQLLTYSTLVGDAGGLPQSLVVQDLDGDGLLDVATVNDHSVTILQGLQDGGLIAVASLPTSAAGAAFIVGADFGGDGGKPPWLAISYYQAAQQPQMDLFENVCP